MANPVTTLLKAAFLFTSILISLDLRGQQSLEIQPERPQRGGTISVIYHSGAPGALIPADAQQVSLVFTYSTFYSLPARLPMVRKGNDWLAALPVPQYATFATFYVESGSIKEQPAPGQHFHVAVYQGDQRVKNGFLHESYSLSAQMGKSPLLLSKQQELIREELKYYPDNYEASVRLLANRMSSSTSAEEKLRLREEARALIAKQLEKAPTVMGNLNLVTMGYLIIGENSRVDSVHRVVMQRFPGSDAALEFIPAVAEKEKTTAAKIAVLERALATAKAPAGEGSKGIHEQLFAYYAGQKNPVNVLQHLAFIRDDHSPYRAKTFKTIAETLTRYQLLPDTAIAYAEQALEIVYQFPIGIIRYFPEFGYIPSFVNAQTRKTELDRVTAQLKATLALNHLAKKDQQTAIREANEALALSADRQTLGDVAQVYEHYRLSEDAFEAYWKILLSDPFDSLAQTAARRNYIAFRPSSEALYEEKLNGLAEVRRTQMLSLATKERLQLPAPELASIVDLKGRPVPTDFFKGKIVVMDFWATWCVPCMEELPYFQKVFERYRNHPNVVFMVINSGSRNTLADAQGWAKEHPEYTFPIYYNNDRAIGEKVGFSLIPTVAVLDGKGKMAFRTVGFEGAMMEHKLSGEIEVLLGDGGK